MEEEWDVLGLETQLEHDFNLKLPISTWLQEDNTLDEEKLRERIQQACQKAYQTKEAQVVFWCDSAI